MDGWTLFVVVLAGMASIAAIQFLVPEGNKFKQPAMWVIAALFILFLAIRFLKPILQKIVV